MLKTSKKTRVRSKGTANRQHRKALPVRNKAYRLKELLIFVQLCFQSLDEQDFAKIAERSGLCISTIHRLARGDATLLVRWGTVQALGYAAGLRLEATPLGYEVRLID